MNKVQAPPWPMWSQGIIGHGRRAQALAEYLQLYSSGMEKVGSPGTSNPSTSTTESAKPPHLFSFGADVGHDLHYTLGELPGEDSSLFPNTVSTSIWAVSKEDLQYIRPEFIMLCFTRRVIFYRLYDLNLTRTLLAMKLENREEELRSLEERATRIGGKAFGEDYVPSDILHAKYQRMYGKSPKWRERL